MPFRSSMGNTLFVLPIRFCRRFKFARIRIKLSPVVVKIVSRLFFLESQYARTSTSSLFQTHVELNSVKLIIAGLTFVVVPLAVRPLHSYLTGWFGTSVGELVYRNLSSEKRGLSEIVRTIKETRKWTRISRFHELASTRRFARCAVLASMGCT